MSGLFNFFTDGEKFANLGKGLSGVGSFYNAFNSKKLMDNQIDLTKQQNNLLMNDYEEQRKRRDKLDGHFSDVWG